MHRANALYKGLVRIYRRLPACTSSCSRRTLATKPTVSYKSQAPPTLDDLRFAEEHRRNNRMAQHRAVCRSVGHDEALHVLCTELGSCDYGNARLSPVRLLSARIIEPARDGRL